MEEASFENPGKMAAIIGLEISSVKKIAKEGGCEVANLNCPGQVIISGGSLAVEKTIELTKAKSSAKCVLLNVSGPFHSSLMNKASERLKKELKTVSFNKPNVPFISNVNANFVDDVDSIRENLALQVNHRTLWEASIRLMMKCGVKKYYEIGPGKVLKGLLEKIDNNLNIYNIEKPADIPMNEK